MNLIWHYKEFNDLTPEELYKILHLRMEVFVVEQDCLYNECDLKDLNCSHLWATMNNEIVAYCRIVPPNVSYVEPSIGRVVTPSRLRGLKLGKKLITLALQICENEFKTPQNRISAQCYLKSFYEQFGFEQCSEEYLEDNLPHMEMFKSV